MGLVHETILNTCHQQDSKTDDYKARFSVTETELGPIFSGDL